MTRFVISFVGIIAVFLLYIQIVGSTGQDVITSVTESALSYIDVFSMLFINYTFIILYACILTCLLKDNSFTKEV